MGSNASKLDPRISSGRTSSTGPLRVPIHPQELARILDCHARAVTLLMAEGTGFLEPSFDPSSVSEDRIFLYNEGLAITVSSDQIST